MMDHAHSATEPESWDEVSIGQMYEYRESVQQDYATALHWYQLAALAREHGRGSPRATNRAAPQPLTHARQRTQQ